tara:strand:+ start:38 stop:622 length:585 start_codon:yes stop_codon:yes gene_type:complete
MPRAKNGTSAKVKPKAPAHTRAGALTAKGKKATAATTAKMRSRALSYDPTKRQVVVGPTPKGGWKSSDKNKRIFGMFGSTTAKDVQRYKERYRNAVKKMTPEQLSSVRQYRGPYAMSFADKPSLRTKGKLTEIRGGAATRTRIPTHTPPQEYVPAKRKPKAEAKYIHVTKRNGKQQQTTRSVYLPTTKKKNGRK